MTCTPTTRPITIRFGRSGDGPSSSATRGSTHSSWAGLSATRGGLTAAEGVLVRPARANSSSPCGAATELAFIASRSAQVARLTTNSPVAAMLARLSLGPPRSCGPDMVLERATAKVSSPHMNSRTG